MTTETIRRDLTVLERAGVLRRVHGGAIPVERLGFEPALATRDAVMTAEKERIAKAAVEELPRDGAFAQAAGRQPVLVMVRAGDGKAVQARSLLAVLSLGAACGTELTLQADGDGAAESLDALAGLLSRDLDAEPVDG